MTNGSDDNSEERAVEAAQRYVAQWSLSSRSARLTLVDNKPPVTPAERRTIRFKLRRLMQRVLPQNSGLLGYTVDVDTGEGIAYVHMSRDFRVQGMGFEPITPDAWLLPLWAVFPLFTSVTIFWRMAPGEDYYCKWRAWYAGLPDADRAMYKQKFPAPTDPERGWEGWYEDVADKPWPHGSVANV